VEKFIYRIFRGVPPTLTSHDWSTKYVLYAEKNYNWGEGKVLSEILSTTSSTSAMRLETSLVASALIAER
jgi:hypothetical protein